MAAQQPAVVIIARYAAPNHMKVYHTDTFRHGPRLDAADKNWHFSTPAPYDPPLTYGGWNQSRALGVRIASLLYAREQSAENDEAIQLPDGVHSFDFAHLDGSRKEHSGEVPRKSRKRKHKVVIHSSPFLRCVQTSIAISAGMAQYQPQIEQGGRTSASGPVKRAGQMHSASPRLRATDGANSPSLAPISEPRTGLARGVARRALQEHKRYHKAKLRVDAFLGEWLSPDYFDNITPPPPSALMVATAKAALVHQESLDVYVPTMSTKSSQGSLWGAANGNGHPRSQSSGDSSLDSWDHIAAALPRTSIRDRANSHSSAGSSASNGHSDPFRSSAGHASVGSTFPKMDSRAYVPPNPSYAVSPSDPIPRGYVAHARDACVDVDYTWDSMKEPQLWGDGGEYGEEWSQMHKRFRKGINSMAQWYGEHGVKEHMREDALAVPEAEDEEDDEDTDLVVVMVTHGAGSNALIGALTNQPVLLDVGMASLTMAVRKPDAPALLNVSMESPSQSPGIDGVPRHTPSPSMMNGHRRRASLDVGLSSAYEMRLVASSEHLRPGTDPSKVPSNSFPASMTTAKDTAPKYRQRFGSASHAAAGAPIESTWNLGEPASKRTGTVPSSLGSIRRASAATIAPISRASTTQLQSDVAEENEPPASQPFSPGLWNPAERAAVFSQLDKPNGRSSPGQDMDLNFSTSPDSSRPGTSSGAESSTEGQPATTYEKKVNGVSHLDGTAEEEPGSSDSDVLADLPQPGSQVPAALSRGLSQRGLWGSRPSGDRIRNVRPGVSHAPKRRWTLQQE